MKIDYKRTALEYHNRYGCNILPIGKGAKIPNIEYTEIGYKVRPQLAQEIETFKTKNGYDAWGLAGGVGIVNGVNGWRCLDFDGYEDPEGGKLPVRFDVVETVLDRLGFDPYTYPWVVESGSGGWHVWVICNQDLPPTRGNWGKILPRPGYDVSVDHIELRWANLQTLAPPTEVIPGNRYTFRNCEVPDTPPAVVGVSDLLYAVDGVAVLPEPIITTTPVENVSDLDSYNALYETNEGDTLAKEQARERFDMVEYIARYLGTDYVEKTWNGETRIGKPGAGHGGWYVTADGLQWNTFRNGDNGKTGGDFLSLVAYTELGVTKPTNKKDWARVFEIVEQLTGVNVRRRAVASTVTVGGNNGNQDSNTDGNESGSTTAHIVRQYINSRYELRRNDLNHRIEWRPLGGESWFNLGDGELNAWGTAVELETGKHIGAERIHRYVDTIARVRRYDPLRDYFDTIPKWDGFDYIRALANTVVADNPGLFLEDLRKWLIGTFATGYYGAIRRKTLNELFLILHSDGQGIGKTTWLDYLIPPALVPYRYMGTISKDKDSTAIQSEHWISINDELETFRKADHKWLKALLSETDYTYRPPYARVGEKRPRRISFCGSTNESTFLTDPTGNRRYLIHTVSKIDYDSLRAIPVDMIWSQARELHNQGVSHWLSPDEMLERNEHTARYVSQSITDEMLPRYFEPGDRDTPGAKFMTATDIAVRMVELFDKEHTTTEVLGLAGETKVRDGVPRPNAERIVVPLGWSLRKWNFTREKRKVGRVAVWGYWVVETAESSRKNEGADDVPF